MRDLGCDCGRDWGCEAGRDCGCDGDVAGVGLSSNDRDRTISKLGGYVSGKTIDGN